MAESYTDWLKKHKVQESADYNTHDAYLSGITPDYRGHLPDTFKKTNHITYSDESAYSKLPGAPPAGSWQDATPDISDEDKKKWVFYASPTNVQNAGGVSKLQDYFNTQEPNSTLVLPPMSGLQDLLKKVK